MKKFFALVALCLTIPAIVGRNPMAPPVQPQDTIDADMDRSADLRATIMMRAKEIIVRLTPSQIASIEQTLRDAFRTRMMEIRPFMTPEQRQAFVNWVISRIQERVTPLNPALREKLEEIVRDEIAKHLDAQVSGAAA